MMMPELLSEQNTSQASFVFQFADIAIAMSELKSRLPLDRFRVNLDSTLLRSLSSAIVQQDFHQYLQMHLNDESSMLSNLDVTTLVHYLVLSSTTDTFGLNFSQINIYKLTQLFKDEIELDLNYFSELDLDQQLLRNLAAFLFVQQYKLAFRYSFADELFQIVCQEEQKRLYKKIFATQSKMFNFLDQVQQNLGIFIDGVMSTNDRSVIPCLQKILQFFNIVEHVLFAITEYKQLTMEIIRLDLSQTSGMVMHFVVQMSSLLKYSNNIPCFVMIHQHIIEKLSVCLEHLFVINKRNVMPISKEFSGTPLCSPLGNIVSYNQGLVQCLLESICQLAHFTLESSQEEVLTLCNLLCRVIAASQQDSEYSQIFKNQIISQQIVSQISILCSLTQQLFQQKSQAAIFVTNLIVDISIALYQARVYIANGSVIRLISMFTLELKGTEQLKQKCCFLMSRLATKKNVEHYFKKDLSNYVIGSDSKIDSILGVQHQKAI
ncbi:Conserved_hypothetical protein [Hexamita inflata]|uniref:Uncharacterized protein n=1 Tax=Hexamita inflata TaxID=28002 RepID=A0AA86PPW5_9EUKA|nr:Conserved hypothetical protein [Hexamita inflata]CAI9954732.1 Conserved hypothetical protein [Hexamita inflata]